MATANQRPVIGPTALMRCRRCGRVFTVKPGHVIAHDRRQGAVYRPCDGALAPDGAGDTGPASEGTGGSTDH